MKLLLLLLLIASCGKHQEPEAKDYRDSDGDQILNEHEVEGMSKYFADVTPMENLQLEMTFEQVGKTLTKHKVLLSNELNLESYAKDLLVRHEKLLKVDDYFSEFSVLRIKKSSALANNIMSKTKVHFNFSETSAKVKEIVLMTGEERLYLGNFQEKTDLELTIEQLQQILAGKAFLAVTRGERKKFFNESQEESIKQKTYRVLFNNGKKTFVYYVAKELTFEKVLEYLGVNRFKRIEDEDLLTTTGKSSLPEWWVRDLNQDDKVIAFRNAKELSDHFLAGFERRLLKLERVNGSLVKPYIVKKHADARVLLKIKSLRSKTLFKEYEKTERYGGGGGRNGDFWSCQNDYRKVMGEQPLEVLAQDFQASFVIRSEGKVMEGFTSFELNADDNGSFWEVELPLGREELVLGLNNLSPDSFRRIGMIKSDCKDLKISQEFHATEGRLVLDVEAFVEKI